MTLIRSHLMPLAVGIGATFLASLAVAATDEKAPPRAKDSREAQVESRVPAPNARLAALIQAGGKIIENKGVDSVQRIDTGVYCIRPKASTGIDPTDSIAVVSVEYFYSLFNEVVVQWASRGHGCGAGRFAVYTLGDFDLDARYRFSNDVGFSIYVP